MIGSIGPGTKLPSLGQIGFVELRDSYEVMLDGLLAGGVDVLLDRDGAGPPPGQGRDRRGAARR